MSVICGAKITLVEKVDLLEYAKVAARGSFEATGEHSPTALVRHGATLCIYSTTFTGPSGASPEVQGQKSSMAAFLVEQAKTADEIIFCCEGWTASLPADTPRSQLPVDLSKFDGREEVVMLRHSDPNGERMLQAKITRDGAGMPTLGEWSEIESEKEAGRFTGLFAKARQHKVN